MTSWLNENPFSHRSHHGTEFSADRCDFRGGVKVVVPKGLSREMMMTDLSEMIGFHATSVLPRLNRFQGYDCISFEVEEV